MKFSFREKKDLLFAGFMISLAFAIAMLGGFNLFSSLDQGVIIVFFIAMVTGGLGFLLHELMHKYVAQSYGLFAEFRAFKGYLWLAVAVSFLGFIFAAPGAVFIHGLITRERNGKISIAGPLTNIVLAIAFLVPLLVVPMSGIAQQVFSFGFRINGWLAAFNMIPVLPFDGAKVLAWDKGIYVVTLIVALALVFGPLILSFFV